MTPNQQKFYILGLQDAIREIEMELECSEYEMQREALSAHLYTYEVCIGAIEELIEATCNGL